MRAPHLDVPAPTGHGLGDPAAPGALVARTAAAGAIVLAAAALASRLGRPATSDDAYRQVVAGLGDAPGWVSHGIEATSELGLVLLAAALAATAWRWRHAPAGLARTLAAGAGVVAAYASSEVLKVLLAQPRPCRIVGLDTLATCPAATDWSLPSNHAVIAVGLAVAVAVSGSPWWRGAALVAVAVAASRVALGVHYPHDVLTGSLLAAAVVVATVVVLDRPVRAVTALSLRRAGRR